MNEAARSLTIYVEDTNQTYNTKLDWGLYIQNFDCIGMPEQHTAYIEVPFSNTQIDASDALVGHPTFIRRAIRVELAGKKTKTAWPNAMSNIRNACEGHICQLTFNNDPSFYYRGRVHIEEFIQELSIGRFTISVPECEPYKYSNQTSATAWLWDPFSFIDGEITKEGSVEVDGSASITIPSGNMYTVPIFMVSPNPRNLKVKCNGFEKNLVYGRNRDPRIQVNGPEQVVLTFTGYGTVDVIYRGGSL